MLQGRLQVGSHLFKGSILIILGNFCEHLGGAVGVEELVLA
jgi:hypothetical protein